ncbi:MAG: tRNA (adenosine(37)-N6)-dimethylallyltransferase MiaA [Thermoleophilaceae bacterium]|nr:tRNA (adenosine(37)-N6)-dimethylallyltransferase MiaA [Thermoleophilaceae bacterium]
MPSPDVVAIFGPTGIGKTSIAIALAELLREGGEDPVAVSVDSMQVYRELPILTGAADAEERAALEHRLIGNVSVADQYDVATHAKLAHAEIDQLRGEGRRPIVVGGTGLYLRAALTELDLMPKPREGVRERLAVVLDQDGLEALYARLEREAPDLAAEVDPNNARRVVRALETLEQGLNPAARDENRLWTEETRVPTRLFALVMDREALYARIEQRVDWMVDNGAADEVRGAEPLAGRTARQALGFEELLNDDVDQMKINTRRYAKRQLTWLNKLAGATLIDVTDRAPGDVAAEISTQVTG